MLERDGKQPLLHSMLLDEYNSSVLSFRYWDYESWIMSKFTNKKVLLLGLGGATSLQVLEKLKIIPHDIVGVDIEANKLKEKGLLNYPYLNIVHSDAHSYLNQTNEKFDLILVDVYNFDGYVESIYKDMELLYSKLNSNGIVALHCLDPMIKYHSFNFSFNQLIPSLSYEIASLASTYFESVYILPLWTSSLVLAGKSEQSLNVINSEVNTKLNQPYTWLDIFYKTRLSHFKEFNEILTRYKSAFDYKSIEKQDDIYLQALFSEIKKTKFKNNFIKIFGDKYNNSIPNGKVKVEFINETNIKSLVLLSNLMSTDKEQLMKGKFNQIIQEIDKDPSKTKESRMIKSYVLAYGGRWDEAVNLLGVSI